MVTNVASVQLRFDVNSLHVGIEGCPIFVIFAANLNNSKLVYAYTRVLLLPALVRSECDQNAVGLLSIENCIIVFGGDEYDGFYYKM